MKKLLVLGALAVAGGLGTAAKADVILPAGPEVRFDMASVYRTTSLPTIDTDANGNLVLLPPAEGAPPVEIRAFGEVVGITGGSSLDPTSQSGSVVPPQELTFTFTGAQLDPTSLVVGASPTGIVSISGRFSGGSFTMYHDDGSGSNLKVGDFRGTSDVGIPGAATDGDVVMTAHGENLKGSVLFTFFKSDPTGAFDRVVIGPSSLAGDLVIDSTSGPLASLRAGDKIGAVQFRPNSDTSLSGAANEWLEATVTIDTIIPEPASASLLAAAGLMLLARRSRRQVA